MKAKVAFGEDIRRWHYPTEGRYAHLVSFVEKVFDLGKHAKEYYIQFEDAELDKVTICNEQDLMDAFECAEQEKRQSLKIFVTAGSVANTHESPKQAKEDEAEEPEEENRKEPECCDWLNVVSFLMSDNIRQLLPEVVKRVISVLRMRKESGEQFSLAEVVPSVLAEKPFEAIATHDCFKKNAGFFLPLLSQASCFNHVLLSLNEEAVEAWVSGMLELVTMSFIDGKDNGLWKVHVDMWREEELHGGQGVHLNVKCDMCGMCPIRGIRYKCATCENYDLCEGCEASGKHPVTHPMLKITRPLCQRMMGRCHFAGLHEVTGRRHRGMFRRGPPCWMRFGCRNTRFPYEKGCGQEHDENEGQEKNKEKKEKKWKCAAKAGKCKRMDKKDKMDKKEKRWSKCQQKLLSRLEKINAKLNENNKIQIPCVCGSTLVKTTAMQAYGHLHVVCDWCSKDCSRDDFIYHCPVDKSQKHPEGFDVCSECAASSAVQLGHQETKEIIEKKEEVIAVDKKDEEEKKDDKVEKTEKPQKEEVPAPPAPAPVPPALPAPPAPPAPAPKDPFEGFAFAENAHTLVEMGFSDHERIKFLLVSKKGDLNQAIFELLSQ